MTNFKAAPQKGFTLVELAIVMIIIGLLVGGVLKGQDMITNARMKATLSDYKSFAAAYFTFIDKYDALPGDMDNATTRIPECNAANNCSDGDGNDIIGTRVDSGTDLSGSAGVQENIQFWKHLAAADLTHSNRVVLSASSAPGDSAFGVTHPRAPIDGGWNAIMTVTGVDDEYGSNGLLFQLTATPNTNSLVISPFIARQLDSKIDDGAPNSGSVKAEYSGSSNCEDDATNTYNETLRSIECILYFEVE